MVETPANSTQVWRFGVFEVDARAMKLRRNGTPIKIREQSFNILVYLLKHAGEIVTREDLRQILWPSDTFVDFDHSLNTAVMKLRESLGDSADKPLYIETIPKRGYRFIAPLSPSVNVRNEAESRNGDSVSSLTAPVEDNLPVGGQSIEETPSQKPKNWTRYFFYGLAFGGVAIVATGLALWKSTTHAPTVPRVVRFTKLTNDGRAKVGRMATDGSRIYFTEMTSEGLNVIDQVSVKGGEVTPLPVSLKQGRVLDLSKDGAELLVADDEGEYGQPRALWVQPVAGGSPQRIGTVLADDAAFGRDETSIIFSRGHDVYLGNRDGSEAHKLFTVSSVPSQFHFSRDASILRFTHHDEATGTSTLMEANADGTDLRKMFAGCCGDWTRNGRLFLFQREVDDRTNLWVLPDSGKTVEWGL